jgi:hypothetical protein
MNIIGIAGLAGSGKDTVADTLVREHGFCRIALADPMKRFCQQMFGFTVAQLFGESANRNAVDPRWDVSPRTVLQQLGTEWGRAMHPDLWIEKALATAERVLVCGDGYAQDVGLIPAGWPDVEPIGVVIPDVRFENEAAAIREAGGEVWAVRRPGAGLQGEAALHASENGLEGLSFDRAIDNVLGLPELRLHVADALADFYAKRRSRAA